VCESFWSNHQSHVTLHSVDDDDNGSGRNNKGLVAATTTIYRHNGSAVVTVDTISVRGLILLCSQGLLSRG
jgi:hypothetical protein